MKSNCFHKKAFLATILVFAAIFSLSACALAAAAPAAAVPKAAAPAVAGTETPLSYLVTAEWLKANLGKVLVVDARAQALYKGQQGHIPGAVNAEPSYFANMSGKAGDPKWHTVLDAAALAKKLGALGIDGKKHVVVYGDGGDWGNAAWVVWILRMTGDKNAKIMDGGWTAWRAAGGKTSNTTHTNKAVAHPAIKFDPNYTATTEWLKEHLNDPAIRIVDVRSDKEYSGEIRPFGERRPGHIPGALNFSMDRVLTKDFKILPEAELQAALTPSFPDKNQVIVLYDTAGVRSSFMTMAFRLAGYKNARNYDPSYHVWCADSTTEVRQGPNP